MVLHESREFAESPELLESGSRPSQPGAPPLPRGREGTLQPGAVGTLVWLQQVLGAAWPLPGNSQLAAELTPQNLDLRVEVGQQCVTQEASETGCRCGPTCHTCSREQIRARGTCRQRQPEASGRREGHFSPGLRQDFPVAQGSGDAPTEKQACDCQGTPRPAICVVGALLRGGLVTPGDLALPHPPTPSPWLLSHPGA